MAETPTYGKINMYLQFDNIIQIRLDEIDKTLDYSIAGICEN